MRIIKAFGFLLFTIPYSLFTFAQSDSCKLHISLLTCSPGEELYSTWGHTAIRVTDSSRGTDLVFNYGTFDDSDPDFYAKFTRGLMIYALSAYPFADFLEEYKSQGRSIIEQTLSLSCADKEKMSQALRKNALSQNRFYKYYFSSDNCTTRAKEMIVKNTNDQVSYKTIISAPPPSFRNLIHYYLDTNHQPWSKLGIDILLGSNLDKKVTNDQAMFLPDYLMTGFDSASLNGHPLVKESHTILSKPNQIAEKTGGFTPQVVFSIMVILWIVLSFSKSKFTQKILNILDFLLFLSLGLLGILLLVLWIIRIDDVCRDNFNLLWAIPTHLPISFVLGKKKKWIRVYFRLVVIITILTAVIWGLLPQQLNIAIAPLLAIIILRSWQRSK